MPRSISTKRKRTPSEFFFVLWRWGELNPRPSETRARFYAGCSGFWFRGEERNPNGTSSSLSPDLSRPAGAAGQSVLAIFEVSHREAKGCLVAGFRPARRRAGGPTRSTATLRSWCSWHLVFAALLGLRSRTPARVARGRHPSTPIIPVERVAAAAAARSTGRTGLAFISTYSVLTCGSSRGHPRAP